MREKRMNKRKCIVSWLLAFGLLLGSLAVPDVEAYADNLIIALSASTVKIGDSLEVTIRMPAGVTGTVNLTYSQEIFAYSSASETANSNAGTVSMTLGSYGSDNKRASGTVTFRAKAAGTCNFVVTAPNAGNQEGDRVTVGGAGASVKVENAVGGDADQSADNSLASLTLSKGKLSPSFSSDVTNYTAEVGNRVTSVTVSAKPSDDAASVESVTGGEDLSVGENTVTVTVRAENGVTAAYTITVTRKAAAVSEPEADETESDAAGDPEKPGYTIDGVKLYPSATLPESGILEGFAQGTITLWEQEYPCIYNEEIGTELCLVYLVDENGENGAWYMVPESEPDYVFPFVCVSYEQYMHTVNGESGDTQADDSAVLSSNDRIEELQSQNRMILWAFVIVVLILLVLIVVLVKKDRDRKLPEEEQEKEPEKVPEEEEELEPEEQQEEETPEEPAPEPEQQQAAREPQREEKPEEDEDIVFLDIS